MTSTRILRLVDLHAKARNRAENRALLSIQRLVKGMARSWYDEAAVAAFAADAATVVSATQRAVGHVTAEFLDAVLAEMEVAPRKATFRLPAQLRNVEPDVEWKRPAEQFRYAKSQGAADDQAQSVAADRAEVLVSDDVTMAMRAAITDRLAASDKIIGYRRVIHPELSKGGTCGLCAVASDRRYHVADLLPVHARCACTVLPITRAMDPGSSINLADLTRLYGEAGSTGAEKLKHTRIKVEDHSELGPQLLAA